MSDFGAGLNFIIVGASVSGLASAIALKNSGHSVLLLEKALQLGGTGSVPNGSGCAEIPPNGTKILLDWGLETALKANSAPISGFSAYKYAAGEASSPDQLGINCWDPELLRAARGGYSQFLHRDLIHILYDHALEPSAGGGSVSALFGAEVVNVDCDACSVTLRSGQVHTGDAIIGADGANGVIRRVLLEEEGESPESDVPAEIVAYSSLVPNNLVRKHNLAAVFDGYPGCTVWFGPNRGLRTFPTGKDHDVSLLLYTPDSSETGTWTGEVGKNIVDVLGPCDGHIQKLAALAGPATCVQIKQPYDLESWVSQSGRVLAVGDAAHPFSPGTGHSYAVALEDGTFIGKIFSHTRDSNRVPEFLRAFHEHREPRCSRLRQMEKEYIFHMTLPDGPFQERRDAAMRERHASGQNLLHGDLQQMLEDYEMMYGYEAADDADEWWISWGRYRDDAAISRGPEAHRPQSGLFNIAFSSFTSQVPGTESVKDI